MTDQTGIMLCGHGSRDTNAVAEFEALASRIRERLPGRNVEFGFLEFARPIIRDGLEKLRERGMTEVLAWDSSWSHSSCREAIRRRYSRVSASSCS